MPHKLTDSSKAHAGNLLSDRRNAPFILCFSRQLENNYEFADLKQADIKELHRFIAKVVGRPYSEADRYLRNPDKNDLTEDNIQIQHYSISKKFRIHGFLQNGLFHVVRLDPEHDFHHK